MTVPAIWCAVTFLSGAMAAMPLDHKRKNAKGDIETLERTTLGKMLAKTVEKGQMPQNEAGTRIEPPPSEPRVSGTVPSATATAEPELDPPAVFERSHGLRVGKKAEFSFEPPMANSSMFVLPTSTAPAAASRVTTVAS
mgnify:CR=1 FL=1